MIVETILGLFFSTMRIAFSTFEMVGLPTQFINVLSTILSYGIWIVGLDIMGIFVSTIVGWWMIKLTVGLVIWLWELLPLT